MSWIQLLVATRRTNTWFPTARPLTLSAVKLRAPTGTYRFVMLCVVPLTVEAEPEPVICTREYWLLAVACKTVPVPFVLLPTPRRTTPLALILIVLAQG